MDFPLHPRALRRSIADQDDCDGRGVNVFLPDDPCNVVGICAVYATVELMVKEFETVENVPQAKETVHVVGVIVVETNEDSAFGRHGVVPRVLGLPQF